ncbi:MAG: ubiquitin-binding protein cue5 [Candelina mexicana]|nr:MAG: ubiquitin-binding protein cue5 [Candelina mexicana]
MAEPKSRTTQSIRAESPTTARELDFDDEPLETSATNGDATAIPKNTPPSSMPKPDSGEDVAPPKPPRPTSPQQQAESTLKEAFPNIDGAVVRAVLTASRGNVEPAFNALLGMSDPDSQKEPTPPPQPPRRAPPPLDANSTGMSQIEADAQYARQLAEHDGNYAAARGGPRNGRGNRGEVPLPKPRKQTALKPNELYDDNHSFFDDDLPVIQENIRKGFLETQTKVSSWVNILKKKLEGEEEDDFESRTSTASPRYNAGRPQQPYGERRSGELGRRSSDRERYDADPRVLGDDFAGLELRDEETQKRRSNRLSANPNLFKPTPTTPQPSSRKVSFQNGPPEDIDGLYRTSPKPTQRQPSPATGGKQSKWQPLSSVDPMPVADTDPFSLGDSDDEREVKSKDMKSDNAERLQKAAAEAMAEDIGSGSNKELGEHEKTGTNDKGVEEKFTGKS